MPEGRPPSLRLRLPRRAPPLAVDEARIDALVREVFPGNRLVGAVPLAGAMNTNLRLELARDPRAVALRLAQGGPGMLVKEVALARRVAGRVPVADVLRVEHDAARLGAPFALLAWIEGATLDAALVDSDAGLALGQAMGAVLAAVHSFAFPHAGVLDAELEVARPLAMTGAHLLAHLRATASRPDIAGRLGAPRVAALLAFLEARADGIEAWMAGPPCLVHGDANGTNMVMRREGGAWRIAAVLDWESAIAGAAAFDLGAALRPFEGLPTGYVEGLAAGYRAAGGRLPADWPALARLADLTTWLDLAGRPAMTAETLADVLRVIDSAIR